MRELQLAKETNVALATKKMELQDKIVQLKMQLSGEGSFKAVFKGKSPIIGLSAPPIGGRGKVICAKELLGLTNWLPSVQTLEQAYQWNRELFFLLVNVQASDVLTHKQVEHVWKKASTYKLKTLFPEILIRGDLSVEDSLKTYWLLGDLAARAFLYHAELEAT